MGIDGKMRKTTENIGNNGKHRKQRKTSETTENVGNNGNNSEMVALSQSQRLESIYASSKGTQTHTHTIQNRQSTKFYSEVRAS